MMVYSFMCNNDRIEFHTVVNPQNRVDTVCLVNGLAQGISKQHPNDEFNHIIGFRIALSRALRARSLPRQERKEAMAQLEQFFAELK